MMNGKNSAGVESAPETDIPTGLNRIKTRRVLLQEPPSSRDDADKVFDSRIPAKHKQVTGQGHGKLKVNGPREGNRNAKKIARWFKLLFRDHSNSKDCNDASQNTKFSEPDVKRFNKECSKSKLQEVGICSTSGQSAAQNISFTKGPKGMKSFSQELGPKGGIRPVYTRSHSFDNLKELLGSLRSRFDAAKEMVNVELSCFVGEVIELFQKNEFSSPKAQIFVDDLLLICQQCVEMTPLELRSQCETIVQDLTEKRKQCQTGLLKWLSTRMLFILTRCTRLLHFEKGSEQLDENSLHKFKKCLDSVPRVEMNWEPEPVIAGSSPCYPLDLKKDSKYKLQELSKVSNTPETPSCRPSIPSDGCISMLRKDYLRADSSMLRKDYLRADHTLSSERPQFNLLSSVPEHRHSVGSYLNEPMDKASYSLPEKETSLDGCDSVLCRICEEVVPTPHLEFHSYICAYAEKCDLRCWDIDDRLSKLAEMLELIIESLNSSTHASYDSPESSRIQTFSPATPSDVCSPNVSEWRNKGVEGMFEDIHEMDTACIDDSVLTGTNMRSHLNMKLGHCGPPSSAGSITSCSSTNTPKTGLFDFFWLDGNIPSELEDVQQMSELVDIARCIAGTYLSKEGSHEVLLACMEDLQDVLQQSKVKALVVDTFGGRIESLLREKYINACDLMDEKCLKSNGSQGENSKVDTASPSSVTSTPQHPSHKERTSIEDFEIIKPISRGAFGKVYLARKRTTGDYFAIKVLKKLHMIRKNDIERILAERNILITARSTFVVRFFYSFTSKDNLYLVMEYLNGGDLYSLLRKVGCLDEDIARIYIAELVLALEYLQSLGIVHRDLKPDNILIAHDGHIKLTDFGLSKIGLMNSTGDLPGPNTDENTISDACGEQTVRTQNNSQRSAVGTPDYLAPEILLGTEHGYAADWWSVGIILFEFITGIPPFTAHCPEIIFDNILNRKIPWPSPPNGMSTEAQDLINRFLVHDPDQRLGSKGSWEVKAHPFFEGVNWDTLALQKAAFVPQLDSVDDTSYFVPRYTRFSAEAPQSSSYCDDSASEVSDSSNNGVEKMDECGALEQFDSTVCLSLMNFSFKNLSQLASINHDVLLQNGKDQSRYTSSSRDPNV